MSCRMPRGHDLQKTNSCILAFRIKFRGLFTINKSVELRKNQIIKKNENPVIASRVQKLQKEKRAKAQFSILDF